MEGIELDQSSESSISATTSTSFLASCFFSNSLAAFLVLAWDKTLSSSSPTSSNLCDSVIGVSSLTILGL
jgi:hypothetical protein